MEDKTLEMTMLFDFFGDLLTEKQREYFYLYYNEDLSLSEIAENAGITRQGVRDIIVRAEKTLRDTEEKTGIIKRFNEMNARLEDAKKSILAIKDLSDHEDIGCLADSVLNTLDELKGQL